MNHLFLAMLLLGLVQGIAEFLPISSSGHLVLLENIDYFKQATSSLTDSGGLFINITLHIATLFGILIFFRKDIVNITRGFFKAAADGNFKGGEIKIVKNIIIASIPAGIAGIILHDFFESVFALPSIVFFMLIINGIVLILTKKIPVKGRKLEEISPLNALFVGVFQALAIIPGISRAGMTITGGMICGLVPEDSARFSFLMAIPVISGAGLLEAVKIVSVGLPSGAAPVIIIAMIFTVIISLISLRILFIAVKKYKLEIFGYYTLIVGALGVIYGFIF